jgi:hypothetical protein
VKKKTASVNPFDYDSKKNTKIRELKLIALRKLYEPRTFKKECPVCDHGIKIYKRKVNSHMAAILCVLYSYTKKTKEIWVHLPNLIAKYSKQGIRGGDYALLRHWGLIEAAVGSRPDGCPRTGMFRITQHGKALVEGLTKIPKYLWIYRSKVVSKTDISLRPKANPLVSIRDCLEERFDYQELMES